MSKQPKVKIIPRGIMSMEDFIRPPKKSENKKAKGSNSDRTTLDKINKSVK